MSKLVSFFVNNQTLFQEYNLTLHYFKYNIYLSGQLEKLQDELFKKKAECFQLQNRLDGTAESLRKIVDYETTTSSLSEDKELNQAMDAQKAINRY